MKILTGMRRCGKSTLLKMLAEKLKEQGVPSERILQYSFDSLEHAQIHTAKRLFAEIQRHLAAGKTYIFLDEIQNVHSWEKAVNALLVGHDVDIYATGSHSQMLAPEISAHLAGRYVCIPIYPLSFAECLALLKARRPSTGSTCRTGQLTSLARRISRRAFAAHILPRKRIPW